jgi:hypothetical protein
MQHAAWKTSDKDWPQYGLGLQISKVGERELFGHSGGYPGHITRSFVDAERRLVVSVLTNAIDGAATQLAEGLFKLLELADSKPRSSAAAGLERFAGRYANVWGVYDIAVLGGRLYVLDPSAADPAADAALLEPVGDTLQDTGSSGYRAVGESYRFTFTQSGVVESVRDSSGLLAHPLDAFTLADRVQVSSVQA